MLQRTVSCILTIMPVALQGPINLVLHMGRVAKEVEVEAGKMLSGRSYVLAGA